jgi:hypothetical protein
VGHNSCATPKTLTERLNESSDVPKLTRQKQTNEKQSRRKESNPTDNPKPSHKLGHITDLSGSERFSMSALLGHAFLTNFYVFLRRYVEFPQIAVSIQMDLAHFLFPKVTHDKQMFGVSLFLIGGTGMTWHARNWSCIFEM